MKNIGSMMNVDGYRDALTTYVIEKGHPVRLDGDTFYGSIADDWQEVNLHRKECPLTSVSPPVEGDEASFVDTFSSTATMYFVEVTASCGCGFITDRKWRYEGNLGEILIGLLATDATETP